MEGRHLFQLSFIFLFLNGSAGCRFLYQEKAQKDLQESTFGNISNLSYSMVHEKVFAPKCIFCHGNSGEVNLESYVSVKQNLAAIERTALVIKSMPKNGSLSLKEGSLLEAWIKAGAPENVDGSLSPSPIPEPPKPEEPPPDLSKVSYGIVRDRVFATRCISCHGKSGDVNLEAYAEVKSNLLAVEKAALINKTMPKDGPLTANEIAILSAWIMAGAPENPDAVPPEEPLRPIFTSINEKIFDLRCVSCHSSSGSASGVLLSNYKNLLDSPRELVLPGNSEESGLYIALTRTDQKRMPPPDQGVPLDPKIIELIGKWIDVGAPEK